jgi:spore germination protein KA
MDLNAKNLERLLGKNLDICFKKIYVGLNKTIRITIVYIEGLTEKEHLSNFIIKPLLEGPDFRHAEKEKEVITLIESGSLYFPLGNKLKDIDSAVSSLFKGNVLLVFDEESVSFSFEVQGFEKRAITEPSSENVIKGPKDTFVEDLMTNISTVRRRIASPDLIIEKAIVGQQTQTTIALIYHKGIASKDIVDDIRKRIDSIRIDGVLATAYIEEYMINKKYSPFPQILFTERPDKFSSNILEGRIGIIIDGFPTALILPATLVTLMQAPEDYSSNFLVSSQIRFLRYLLIIVTLFLPGFYIAVTSFHHEMLPTVLILSVKIAKEGVPFPTFIETIGLLIAFEILVEAGIRLPKSIGQALSIVGAVVVGQAAAQAKLSSPAVVVLISVTAISNFVLPNQDLSNAIRLWRLIIAILSSIAGLFGMCIGGLLLLYHLCSIENYGVPYLSPFVSSTNPQFQDTFIRSPVRFMKKRPIDLKTLNKKRID